MSASTTDGSRDAPSKHVWVRCESPGCSGKGMWTRRGDMRVLCTDCDRQALLAPEASPR